MNDHNNTTSENNQEFNSGMPDFLKPQGKISMGLGTAANKIANSNSCCTVDEKMFCDLANDKNPENKDK